MQPGGPEDNRQVTYLNNRRKTSHTEPMRSNLHDLSHTEPLCSDSVTSLKELTLSRSRCVTKNQRNCRHR